MKLSDLVEALASEVENIRPELEHTLESLVSLDADTMEFTDAYDQLGSLSQRLGNASEAAGFPGLAAVCGQVSNNALLLVSLPPAEREPLIEFLSLWPPKIVFYLRNLDDPSAAAGLVDHLTHAPLPLPEEQALKIAYMLGSMDSSVHWAGANPEEQRPIVATAEDVALDLAADVDQALLDGFFTEAPDQAAYLIKLARNLASGKGDTSDLVAAKRVLHTFKGSGSITGLRGLANLGHHFEDILDHVEGHADTLSEPLAGALLDAAYCIEQMISHILGTDAFPAQAQQVLQHVLDLANRLDRGETISASSAPAVRSAPTADEMGNATATNEPRSTVTITPTATLRIPVERMDELFRVSGEVSVQDAAMDARLKLLAEASRSLRAQNRRVQQRLFELQTLVDVRALAPMRSHSAATGDNGDAAFDPLEMDQYNELHSTTYALMEEAADARALTTRLDAAIAGTGGAHTRQARLAKDLQHLVAAMRMTEVGALAPRLQRNVRVTCQATGKRAELIIEGDDTLIDSDVLNRLAAPLLHLLRNAVDHGIETPAERAKAGKPEVGRIHLVFSRQGHQVVMRCMDDGRGLDYGAIRERAEKHGLLNVGQTTSNEELARLILLPGFSTRQAVDELSGRGVGLDVVREWAAAMNGSINITSDRGAGCTYALRFAASLSTMHALIVESAGQRLALPAAQVVRAVPRGIGRFEAMAESLVYHVAAKQGNDQAYPALVLADAAALSGTPPVIEDCDVVIVRVDDQIRALAVERLLDARELVVKHPGRYARHLRTVAGLAVLGDGNVATVLDLSQLLTHAQRRPTIERNSTTGQETPRPRQRPGVLIVDDALTVRNSLREMVNDVGYRVQAVRDGTEAVAALSEFKPHVVLTDLEMPNMNGIELTTYIRRHDGIRDLPVIMITSRSQDKHRRAADSAGVDVFLTKPYNEGDLLNLIRDAVTRSTQPVERSLAKDWQDDTADIALAVADNPVQ